MSWRQEELKYKVILGFLGVQGPAGDSRDPMSKLIINGVKCPDLKYTASIFKNTDIGTQDEENGCLSSIGQDLEAELPVLRQWSSHCATLLRLW